ncbi:MAG: hypothetical protein R3348_04550 [Xanthomonadales bacterium]|nr:hypothetical protein [Xanthomonadales bacterium]
MNKAMTCILNVAAMAAALAWATTSQAGNFTISSAFDGGEPSMAAGADNCDATPRPYREVGAFGVTAFGSYRVIDAGNDFAVDAPLGSIADVVVLIYNNDFDPANPSQNLRTSVDETGVVNLNSGETYVLVVQHWCEEIVGAFGVIMDGPGDVTGLGFETLEHTHGAFSSESPIADFGSLGVRRYQKSDPVPINSTGFHYFSDLSPELGSGGIIVNVYLGSFNPGDTSDNLVATTNFQRSRPIEIDTPGNYVFVAVNVSDFFGRWQYALFPPGSTIFNPGLAGAWGTPGVDAAGIMMTIFPETGVAFFAWFTYPEQLIVQARASTEADADSTRPETHVGSSDQRWLTAFGFLPDEGNFMNIAYENASGGAFDSPTPEATINSSYGTGWIELFSCDHFNLNYDLPGGLTRTTEMRRLVVDGRTYCREFIKAAPISPPF